MRSLIKKENYLEKKSSIIEKASTSPTTKDRIISQVSKLGNTPFKANFIEVECDEDIFVSIKELNDLKKYDEIRNNSQLKNANQRYRKINDKDILIRSYKVESICDKTFNLDEIK